MNGQVPSHYRVEAIPSELRARLAYLAKRGAYQGWIGDYVVYQKDGTTHGYHHTNRTDKPDYIGSESGLYKFAGREEFPEYARRF